MFYGLRKGISTFLLATAHTFLSYIAIHETQHNIIIFLSKNTAFEIQITSYEQKYHEHK